MELDFNTIATGILGLFASIGAFVLLIAKNKDTLAGFFKKEKTENDNCLENHFLFAELQLWQDYQIDAKCNNVACPVRSGIAKKFLHLRFEMKEEYYKNLVQYIKTNKLTFQHIAEHKSLMEDEFARQASLIGIPEIVVQRFKQHISQTEIIDMYFYERLIQYKFCRTDEEKLNAIFCIDLKDIYIAGKDIEDVIMGLNGEIDKCLGIKKIKET